MLRSALVCLLNGYIRLAITCPIPSHTGTCIHASGCPIPLPTAKTIPVEPELVPICYPSKCSDVGSSSSKILKFLRCKGPRLLCLLVVEPHWKTRGIPRKGRRFPVGAVGALETERRSIPAVRNLQDTVRLKPSDSALTEVNKFTVHDNNLIGRQIWPRVSNFDPCSFVCLKIMSEIVPLKISKNGIHDTSKNAYRFQNFFPIGCFYSVDISSPPWLALAAILLGALGIGWGWRNDRGLPWSLLAFLAGICLFAHACLAILPWLADRQF